MDRARLTAMSAADKRAYLKQILLQRKPGARPPGPVSIIPRLTESPEFLELRERKRQVEAWGATDIYFRQTDGVSRNVVTIGDREMTNYSCYNYVGLSGDPNVAQAAKDAIDAFGTSASASRIASGEKPPHGELERAIAEFLGTEDAIAMVGGYSTNESVIGHVMGERDLILYDSLIHASIQRGSRLSGATVRAFPHNRWQALDAMLAEERHRYEKALVVIEGVYSMDGDIPDLPEFIRVKNERKTMLMVDEAHSLGVIGETGRGVGEYYRVDRRDVDLWMGTLSKALAACGGYIAGTGELIEYLRFTTPGFVYSVGLPPADAAAARMAVKILDEQPERVRRLQANGRRFLDAAQGKGWNTGSSKDSAVIPLILGDSAACIRLYHALFDHGVFVIPVVYPAVAENAARLRFFINSTHSNEELDRTVDAVESCRRPSPVGRQP
jgi:8-amino-7-oxononanoate synthase